MTSSCHFSYKAVDVQKPQIYCIYSALNHSRTISSDVRPIPYNVLWPWETFEGHSGHCNSVRNIPVYRINTTKHVTEIPSLPVSRVILFFSELNHFATFRQGYGLRVELGPPSTTINKKCPLMHVLCFWQHTDEQDCPDVTCYRLQNSPSVYLPGGLPSDLWNTPSPNLNQSETNLIGKETHVKFWASVAGMAARLFHLSTGCTPSSYSWSRLLHTYISGPQNIMLLMHVGHCAITSRLSRSEKSTSTTITCTCWPGTWPRWSKDDIGNSSLTSTCYSRSVWRQQCSCVTYWWRHPRTWRSPVVGPSTDASRSICNSSSENLIRSPVFELRH